MTATPPAGQTATDGILQVHEVYELDLQETNLVVLSACETNLGWQSAGDDFVGLNRAFIFAGTPTVVASLWKVNDASTKEFMTQFYTYLNDGLDKAQALRQTQLDMQQDPRYKHPHFWAAFVLTGDGAGKIGRHSR